MTKIAEIKKEIINLKKKNNIVILAHSYQSPDIIEIADITGDSFALSVAAKEIKSDTVIMCGVRFMADTVKILSPDKKVILANENATCPMAEMISPKRVEEFKANNPETAVVAYVNTTTELKAVADICVTSSSALKIVSALKNENILFIPDKNLGSYIKEKCPDKNIILWDGYCPVHNSVTEQECVDIKSKYPQMKILMHPELPAEVLKYADLIGSTAEILKYARAHDDDCVIGTEISISDILSLENPNNSYPVLSKKLICADMHITSLSDVLKALKGQGYEINLDYELMNKARRSINEMIRLG